MGSLRDKAIGRIALEHQRRADLKHHRKVVARSKIRQLHREGKKPPLALRSGRVIHRTLSSLDQHNYRLYFFGQAISLSGVWMQAIAQSLLVLQLTGSGTALGIVMGLQYAPILLLAPLGSIIADRFPKRRVLFVTQSAAAVLALILGTLVVTGTLQLWMLYVLAAVLGVVNAIDAPTVQVFLHELVVNPRLGSAIKLNALAANASRVAGPVLAGIVIAHFGLAPCFFINALTFSAVLGALRLMDDHQLRPTPRVAIARTPLIDGFSYAWRTPIIRNVLLMMALVGMLSYEFAVSLPILARSLALSSGATIATTIALLTSAMGVGAIIASVVATGDRHALMKSLIIRSLALATSMLLLAVSPSIFTAALAAGVAGFFSASFTTLNNATLQFSATYDMRARVMALWSMAFLGAAAIGAPIIGWVGQNFGAGWPLVIGAVAAIAAAAIGFRSLELYRHLMNLGVEARFDGPVCQLPPRISRANPEPRSFLR